MSDSNAITKFLRDYEATPVGLTPNLPLLQEVDDEADEAEKDIDLTVEQSPDQWEPKLIPEQPTAGPGEFPVRFIDGCQSGQPVLCLSAWGRGWPIPLFLSEVGAVALRLERRRFVREFHVVERVLSFVADPFPWDRVEAFTTALANDPEFQIRVLPANLPPPQHNPFDYEVMRTQARSRAQQEMTTLERLALAVDRSVPTLVDGALKRVMGTPQPHDPLLVGVVKVQSASYLDENGWRTLLSLRPAHRTPVFQINVPSHESRGYLSVASWYLKLAGGPRLAPNWGHVRVEVPWGQYLHHGGHESGFVDRLSRWLIDARCRAESYTRMPVSLDPIVRAEESLKPLFTPLPVLVNRLYRRAGIFRRNEL
jgi:hypothetical protein